MRLRKKAKATRRRPRARQRGKRPKAKAKPKPKLKAKRAKAKRVKKLRAKKAKKLRGKGNRRKDKEGLYGMVQEVAPPPFLSQPDSPFKDFRINSFYSTGSLISWSKRCILFAFKFSFRSDLQITYFRF